MLFQKLQYLKLPHQTASHRYCLRVAANKVFIIERATIDALASLGTGRHGCRMSMYVTWLLHRRRVHIVLLLNYWHTEEREAKHQRRANPIEAEIQYPMICL